MKFARVVIRAEGTRETAPAVLTPVMFDIHHDFHPVTADECRLLEEPIRRYLTQEFGDQNPVEEIWFSRPEKLLCPSIGQDIVVDGGARLGFGPHLRFRCEIHHSFCYCAYCRDEGIVAGGTFWLR